MSKIPTKKEVLEEIKLLSIPIDYEQLEKEGVLEKKGCWYKVLNSKLLPEHASKRITEFQNDAKGNLLVKFSKPRKQKK